MHELNKKLPLLIINGPTAAGKTGISIELAKRLGGEVISADSMQVYRHMDIGTAKIRPEEMQGVKHHLIDICDPDEEFSVAVFKEYAQNCIRAVHEKGRLPILVGGTGFYIQAVLYDIGFDNTQEGIESHSVKSTDSLSAEDIDSMFDRLKSIDPAYAEIIHKNDLKRVKNALRFYDETGKLMSQHNSEQLEKESPYDFLYVVLTDKREQIYLNIEKRIDIMMEQGLVAEVRMLLDSGYKRELVSMQGLGYKEIAAYIAGEADLSEAIEVLKRNTRHFAKRQLTWFKREQNRHGSERIIFADKSLYKDDKEVIDYIYSLVSKRRLCAE